MTPPEERNSEVQPSLLLATVVSASQTSVPEGERHSSHLTLLGRERPHLRLCHAGDSEQEGRRAGLRSPARGPCRGRWLGPAPRAPAAADARSREAAVAAASVASAASAAAPGGLGQGRPAGQTDRRHRSCHGGSLLRRGPCGSCLRSCELREAAPDPVAGRILGFLYCRVRAHSQRRLCKRGQRSRVALCLQRKRGRLSLRRRAGSRGLHRLRCLPAVGRAFSADQQRPRPSPRRASGPGLLRCLVLPVVRRLLFPHQSVAAHSARTRHCTGWGCGAGRHRVQLLLHPQLGGTHREGPTAVPPGHRYVSVCHRSARCWGCPGLPRLPSGQWCGGHRNIPEPALHRNPGHQPQRVPGACILVAVTLRPGLEGHLTIVGLEASWDLSWVLPSQCQGQRKWPLWVSGTKGSSLPRIPGLSP